MLLVKCCAFRLEYQTNQRMCVLARVLLLKIRGIRPICVIRVEKSVASTNLGVGIIFETQSTVISTTFQALSVPIYLKRPAKSCFPARQLKR